ncbi:MAG: hypothetical protein M3O34_13605 [Chloroflexota bacterium]|nr:hypothetical protein [Chloroflexota bacterium]
MIGRVIKRVVRRLIRGLIVHPIRGVIMLVVLLAVAAVLLGQGSMPAFSLSMPSLPQVGHTAPAATENYMRGTTTFDAQLVWEALSDEAQSRYASRGGDLQTLQAQMDQAKQAGAQLGQVTYIGGQALPDGSSLHFYTVLTRGPQAGGEPEYVPYVFTLDPAGKITRVQ